MRPHRPYPSFDDEDTPHIPTYPPRETKNCMKRKQKSKGILYYYKIIYRFYYK